MCIFGQSLLVDEQKVPYLYKTISKEFEFTQLPLLWQQWHFKMADILALRYFNS